MGRLFLVHGINSTGGGLQELAVELEAYGADVVRWRIEKRHFWHAWGGETIRRDGRALAQAMRPGDDLVCHSYGGLVFHASINAGAQWGKCFLFSPACTSDKFHYPADALDECHTFYNPEDAALWFGSLLPFSRFGRMGRRGFAWNAPPPGYEPPPDWDGLDRRFFNHPVPQDKFLRLDHSHYFKDPHIERVLKIIRKARGEK